MTSSAVRIVHWSDMHISPLNQTSDFDTVSRDKFLAAADFLVRNRAHYDVVLCSGDIGHHSDLECYRFAREAFERIDRPWLAIPGNHDDRDLMLQALYEGVLPYSLGVDGSLSQHVSLAGVEFVLLDAADSRVIQYGGKLSSTVWEKLETLVANCRSPLVIAVHYPPHLIDSIAVDGLIQLEESERLHSMLAQSPAPSKVVLSGHAHTSFQLQRDSVLYVTVGSISSSFPSLPNQKDFITDHNSMPSMNLVTVDFDRVSVKQLTAPWW